MDNCIFCKIANKDIPSYTLYEDNKCIVFLDLSQATIGHCLVVPKTHYSNILEIDDEVLAHLIKVSKKICKSMKNIEGIEGFNILNNCGEVAGQSVHHFHLHIIPRYNNDEMIIKPSKENKLSEEQFKELVNKIKSKI